MRSFNPLLVLILSFVPFVLSFPSPSSRLAKNQISSRQFHYPRTLIDICANIDLSLLLPDVLGLNLGSSTCLCLSAFPLDLSVDSHTKLAAKNIDPIQLDLQMRRLVQNSGTQCTFPDHSSPRCSSGNVCDFSCLDGFSRGGNSCVCPPPKSVCNGKCGSYPNGCGSAVPTPPKKARRHVISSPRIRAPASPSPPDSLRLDVDSIISLNTGPYFTPAETNYLLDPEQVPDKLASLGIYKLDYRLNTAANSAVDINVNLGNTLAGDDKLNTAVYDLIGATMDALLGTHVTIETDSNLATSFVPSQADDLVVQISVSSLLDGISPSVGNQFVNDLSSGISMVLTDVLYVPVLIVVDGGSDCGCTGSRRASPRN